MYLNNNHLLILLILGHVLGLIFYYNFDSLRNMVYLVPVAAGATYILSLVLGANLMVAQNHHVFFIRKYLGYYYLLAYLIITQSLFAFIFNYPFHTRFFSEILFTLFPLISITALTYYFKPEKYDKYVMLIFSGVVIAFIFQKGPGSLFDFSGFDIVKNLIYSEFTGESGLAFLIGIFFFYFLFRKKTALSIISLFLVLVSGKRAVLGATLIAIIFYFIFKKFYKTRSSPTMLIGFLGLVANGLIIYFIFIFTEGFFNDWIQAKTGLPVNSLTNGRYNLWGLLIDHFGVRYFGVGLGSSNNLLGTLNYSLENPLNDILKLFLEQGILVFSIWIFLFYYVNSKNIKNLTVVVYSNIIFLTTNVLIYFFFMFTYYLVQLGLLVAERNRLSQKISDNA
jgi:hypothetical protein